LQWPAARDKVLAAARDARGCNTSGGDVPPAIEPIPPADTPTPVLRRYLLALAIIAGGTLLRIAINPLAGGEVPFVVYIVAIVLVTWFCGVGPGALSIPLLIVLAEYLFVPDGYLMQFGRQDVTAVVTFSALGAGLVVLVGRWRSAERALQRRAAETQAALDAVGASERLYRAIGESIDFGVWVCSPDGRNIYASPSFLRLVGLTQQQCSDFGWGDVLHPDDAARTLEAWKACVQAGSVWDIEHRYRGVDGRWHPILARGVPVRDERGEISAWAGINLDISQLKQAESDLRDAKQKIESLLENSPLAVIEWSSGDFRIVRWSDEATRLFGWAADETVGRRIDELNWIFPEDQPIVEKVMTDMMAGTRPRNVTRNRNIRKDGRVIHCEWYNSTLHRGAGQFSVLSLVLDVTERNRAQKELADANRAKDEFLSVLSHELRTPLNAVLGWSDMLLRHTLDPAATRRALEAINRNAASQSALISDLLDVSRIVSGKLRLDLSPVDLGTVLLAAVDATKPSADAKGIAITTSVAEPAIVVGDSDRLQQVFSNLLSNSVKFTPAGGRIDAAVIQAESRFEVSVRDTGEGIRAEFLPRVFDRFSQADSGTRRAPQHGLGLGLAIVRHLTELHGGTVRAESTGEGQGSTFTVSLPVAAVFTGRDEAGSDAARARGDQPPPRPDALAGIRALVVDDQEDARLLLQAALRQFGADVTLCWNAADAIEAIERERPDVVIADIGMPEMDGFEMMRRVRSLPTPAAGTTAIALTAFGGADDRLRALEAGFQDHLAKPVIPDHLVSVIAASVSTARAR
jgi:PAS domain S-box-containing protein